MLVDHLQEHYGNQQLAASQQLAALPALKQLEAAKGSCCLFFFSKVAVLNSSPTGNWLFPGADGFTAI
jgi:hypothetical protein